MISSLTACVKAIQHEIVNFQLNYPTFKWILYEDTVFSMPSNSAIVSSKPFKTLAIRSSSDSSNEWILAYYKKFSSGDIK